ncbi:hypothetical protein JQC92_01480 [Shewanella sp. 202IG2-18]|uniref:hypothetical protein n=1 Tax=Parashewanella hymeniacidonis TaxID=2807618 RepID=UPI00195FE01A|nr:hypothetical protein [Parashewanella hymeniacidonis]MBM7070714.1 hypothetical protein [Parashewanella hymeniacidonis]
MNKHVAIILFGLLYTSTSAVATEHGIMQQAKQSLMPFKKQLIPMIPEDARFQRECTTC